MAGPAKAAELQEILSLFNWLDEIALLRMSDTRRCRLKNKQARVGTRRNVCQSFLKVADGLGKPHLKTAQQVAQVSHHLSSNPATPEADSDGQVWLKRPPKPSSRDDGWPVWREQPSVGLAILHLCSGFSLSVCQALLPPPVLFPKVPLLPCGPLGMSVCLSLPWWEGEGLLTEIS